MDRGMRSCRCMCGSRSGSGAVPRLAIPGVLRLLAALGCHAVLRGHLRVIRARWRVVDFAALVPDDRPWRWGPVGGGCRRFEPKRAQGIYLLLACGLLPEHHRLQRLQA